MHQGHNFNKFHKDVFLSIFDDMTIIQSRPCGADQGGPSDARGFVPLPA